MSNDNEKETVGQAVIMPRFTCPTAQEFEAVSRAVNAHDSLVGALEDARNICRDFAVKSKDLSYHDAADRFDCILAGARGEVPHV